MPSVLHIEDNVGDIVLTKEAIAEARLEIDYICAKTGEEAFTILSEMEELPKLILLDLNLPTINGKEFLEKRNLSKTWANIPVVMLTTSENPEDVKDCYSLNVNAYLIKSLGFEEYTEMIKSTLDFWVLRNLVRPRKRTE